MRFSLCYINFVGLHLFTNDFRSKYGLLGTWERLGTGFFNLNPHEI